MKHLFLISLFIMTLFTACSRPDKMVFYKQNANISKYPLAWQQLLLLPDEYLPEAAVKHFQHPPFMSHFQKSNPGFIDIQKFQKNFPKHDLGQLLLWYSASFFHKPYITHYMIMEFSNEIEAKSYVKRLTSNDPRKFVRILRYKTILFSFTIRDFKENLINKNQALLSETWINQTIKRIMESL
jgi:hypothetical protein